MTRRDLTPFLDARQNQLQLENAAGDAIDTKALAVLASDFAALLFIAQSTSIDLHSFVVTVIMIIFGTALFLTCIAVWPRRYAGASVNMFDHPEYLQYSAVALVKQLISDTEKAILVNKQINIQRWKLCRGALVLTLIASAALLLVLYF